MKNLSVYQYTDMALYINNSEEELGLINENIVKYKEILDDVIFISLIFTFSGKTGICGALFIFIF